MRTTRNLRRMLDFLVILGLIIFSYNFSAIKRYVKSINSYLCDSMNIVNYTISSGIGHMYFNMKGGIYES